MFKAEDFRKYPRPDTKYPIEQFPFGPPTKSFRDKDSNVDKENDGRQKKTSDTAST